MNGYLSITQLSKIKHITTETLRHYDRIKLFIPDYVDPSSGYRYYSLSQIEKIDTIIELRDMGMSLKDIKDFMENRNVELSYQLLIQKEQELAQEIKEKSLLRKNLMEKIQFMEKIRQTESEGRGFECEIQYFEEKEYVVAEHFQSKKDQYMLDITMLKENLFDRMYYFATNYVSAFIEKDSFLDEKEKKFARAASLPASKCRKKLVCGKRMVMPAGEYLCGSGRGIFRYGGETHTKIKSWLARNHYEICGDILEYDTIDLSLTNKEEERIFNFNIPVKRC